MVRYARRLQQIGSSILISLPSQWVKDNNLKKGSIVPVEVNRDNTISIFPSSEEAESTKEVTIQYSPASMDSLVNQVYGAYLLGYDMIRVKAAGSITYDDAERFKRAMRKLVGLEIVEEDRQTISSQFLLDPNTLDAEKILRRMNSLVAGMFREMLEAIKERENIAKRSIGGRDDEVDRQYFLLVRLIRSAMMDQQLAGKLNLSNIDILDYRIAANLLESAGDFIVDLASMQDFTKLDLVDRFVQAGELVEKMQEKAVAAFAGKNRAESVEVVSTYGRFNEIINSIKEEASANADSKGSESTVAVLNLTYSMDRIARCWVDIADLVKPMHLIAPLKNA
ncbi:phosphate uptake regulator [Candidatus Nitrososphaera evergladensis SR1]|jgi:phosphate uptake regulator|uniref:Phosphate uptake regulator n=1 Tax=Candidatus Nitrososphaera evergladensis SR1 TaxID=1459636 RepID=A0A075MST9_9ARCH|nr:phosphate uptake regulator PhoU [Candidatus Nitrososphaera evergladensis]AIF84641.1 phosphate uptake regulator [Candidatus Nitrososphaera evergladensis SR1]